MAVRMQQRRGTAAQWLSVNGGNGPILNAGEIGYETDTNKFKIGDGTTAWINLDYFSDDNSIVNPSFGSSITFEGATSNDFETTVQVADPTADRTITLPDATGQVVLRDTTDTLTNKTLTTPTLTTPRFGSAGEIDDANGNELIKFPATVTSAINEITITNAAVGTTPSIAATGDDTNISLNLISKGTGTVQANGIAVVNLSGSQTLTNKTINGANNTLTVRLANDVSGTLPVANGGTGITAFGTGVATALGVNTGSAGAFVVNGGALGTPSSGTLTNATGLPVSGITASTTTALGVGSIELGHATDTTLSRSSAGVLAVEGVVVPTISSTNTLTNKSLSTTTTNFIDATDATKRLNITTSGNTTNITGTLSTAFTTAKTLTLPDATDTLVGKATTDTLTNKSIALGSNTVTGTIAQFNTAVTDADFATLAGTETLTNKTIALGSNTVSGTLSQFNTAVTDADLASLAGTETLTNKTLGSGTALSANLNANSNKITALATPTASTDAATKQYVDDVAQGLHVHASCVAATTANLTATYSNGSSGVGATLTNSGTQAALVIDGVTLSVNDRVLVKNQTTTFQNGIYTVTNTGSVSTNWVLTRALDTDEAVEIDGGDFVFITGGTAGDNTGWVQTETGVTVGTSAVLYQQFSGAGSYLAGTGLTLTGSTFSINTAKTADIDSVQTFTNKTISLANNTITGTTAQFNTALSDNDFATLAGTETLTNKTFTDSVTTFQDNADNSKKLQFELSGITTATTRTLTVPNASGTISLTSDKLSAHAATTSAELAGVISDETGSGALVFGTSPALAGTPTAPTAAVDTNTTQIATTAYVVGQGYAKLAGPALTGTPTAPTAAANTNTTQIATTAFVLGQGNSTAATIAMNGTQAAGTSNLYARADHVHPSDTSRAATSGTLAQFAATTSAQLAGVISDETGSGALVFGTSPTIATPTLTLATSSSTTDARMSWDTTWKNLQIGNGTTTLNIAPYSSNTTAKTGAFTLGSADANTIMQCNGTFTITVPLNSTTAFPIGTQIDFVQTSGQVTFSFTGGITSYATPGLKLRAVGSVATLIKLNTDTWALTGDLTA